MVKANIKEIHETIKAMLRYAMTLAESPIPEMYELGHYLADNILTKVCFAVAIDKGVEQKIYKSKNRTKDFPDLYKDHLKHYYIQLPDYDPHIKDFHKDRNVYQHEIECFDRTMRQPRAKAYVDLVEDIMKVVGIIKSGEIIRPANLSPFGTSDLSIQQNKTLEAKYKVKELINILENYENIKNNVNLEKKSIQELALLFPSLIYTNMDFKFTANNRPDTIKNIHFMINWSPIGINPTNKFLITRMAGIDRVKVKMPEEKYYSHQYSKNNPEMYKKCDKKVLDDLIIYLKQNK